MAAASGVMDLEEKKQPEAGAKRYRMSDGFIVRQMAGETVIVPVGDSPAFGNAMLAPNRPAAFLWEAFAEPSTEEDVVRKALERFEGPEEEIRAHVKLFIRETLARQAMMEVD